MIDIEEVVRRAFHEKSRGSTSGEIELNTKISDLNMDSLDIIEVMFDIEEELGIEIQYNANVEGEDVMNMSVGDFLTLTQSALEVEPK